MASLHSEAPVSQPVWARDVPEEGQCGGGGGQEAFQGASKTWELWKEKKEKKPLRSGANLQSPEKEMNEIPLVSSEDCGLKDVCF